MTKTHDQDSFFPKPKRGTSVRYRFTPWTTEEDTEEDSRHTVSKIYTARDGRRVGPNFAEFRGPRRLARQIQRLLNGDERAKERRRKGPQRA